jgi:flagellin
VQTAEGALTETHQILQRMRDLAVQSSTGGSQDTNAQAAADLEFTQLKTELDRIANTTSFGSQKLLDGSYGLSNQVSSTGALFISGTATGTEDINFSFKLNGITIIVTASNTAAQTTVDGLISNVMADIKSQLTAQGASGNEVVITAATTPVGGTKFTVSSQYALFTVSGASNFAGVAAASSAVGGSSGVFQVGANNNANERIAVSITKQDSATLGVNNSSLTSATNAQAAISSIDAAITKVSNTRATLGAYQNRFEHTINNLNVAVENLAASESRIRDTDMAEEMVSFTRSQILSQAGTAMLAQANQAPQTVLSLLR